MVRAKGPQSIGSQDSIVSLVIAIHLQTVIDAILQKAVLDTWSDDSFINVIVKIAETRFGKLYFVLRLFRTIAPVLTCTKSALHTDALTTVGTVPKLGFRKQPNCMQGQVSAAAAHSLCFTASQRKST